MIRDDTTLECLLGFANFVSDVPLTDLSDDSAYEALVALLYSSQLAINQQVDEHYRIMIANFLVKLNAPVAKPLLDYLKPASTGRRRHSFFYEHNRDMSRCAVAELLGNHDDESVVPGLLVAMETESNLRVLKSIVHGLMLSNDRDVIAILTEHLFTHERQIIRAVIAEVLGNFPDKGVELSLVLAMNDTNSDIAFTAIRSLGILQSQVAIPFLAEIAFTVGGASYIDRNHRKVLAIKAIKAMGTDETNRLVFDWCIDTIENNRGQMQKEAIRILASLGDNRAISIFIKLLNTNSSTKTSSITKMTKSSLLKINTPEALSALKDWQQAHP